MATGRKHPSVVRASGGNERPSRFSQALAESRAELGRSLLVQGLVHRSAQPALVARGIRLTRKRGVAIRSGRNWGILPFAAYLHLTRRLLRFTMVEVIRALLPGLFAGAVVGLALGLVRITLSSEISSPFIVLIAEFLAGSTRLRPWCPTMGRAQYTPRTMVECKCVWCFGPSLEDGRRWRLALLVLGAPEEVPKGSEPQ